MSEHTEKEQKKSVRSTKTHHEADSLPKHDIHENLSDDLSTPMSPATIIHLQSVVGNHQVQRLLAHNAMNQIQRYGTPIPTVKKPSVLTMSQFIDLVKRVESANPGDAINTARLIMRTKYNSTAWDWLLPSSAGTAGVSASGGVTSADVNTMGGEFEVDLPYGGRTDPSHIVVGLVANAETQSAGAGGAGGLKGKLVSQPPAGLSQRDITTWVGDVASAAAEWSVSHPHPKGGTTKQSYLDEFAPESDLIADVDGIAMTSTNPAQGFAFDHSQPLSANLESFYFAPIPMISGQDRRFHLFCAEEGLSLLSDGVTLTPTSISNIHKRVELNTEWFQKNDPNLLTWVSMNTSSGGGLAGGRINWGSVIFSRELVKRANDWKWFADKFVDFVQKNLKAEGR